MALDKLVYDLNQTLLRLRQQIEFIYHEAEYRGIAPYRMMDAHGGYILAPLLSAEAQVLSALAHAALFKTESKETKT